MTAASRTLRLGGQRVPFVPPSIRDPRLHTAAVIVSIHTLGITTLGFEVSVPQILSAILTAALVDVIVTFAQTQKLVWPASGMLTGSGVALILRLVEMESGLYWAWGGWHYYAVVAGISMATKYLIRWRGEHLFNPSNVGLVAVFLVLGSGLVEPLDFWWAPLGPWMIAAYAVIIVGGVLITRRLDLLKLAVVFWVVLSAGLGVLAGSGHCMVATWAPEPVCGADFWLTLVTSPEILIFQLFMITDPKTIPSGRRSRLVFAAMLGVLATLLIAPHGIEFGAKVGLLSSLVLLTPLRALFDRYVPETPRSATPKRAFSRGVAIGSGMAVVSFLVLVLGIPARESPSAFAVEPEPPPMVSTTTSSPASTLPETSSTTTTVSEVEVNPSTIPTVTTRPDIRTLDLAEEPQELAAIVVENLQTEATAIREGDPALLASVDSGPRLEEMSQRIDEGAINGRRRVSEYTFDSMVLGVDQAEGQSSAALALFGTGVEDVVTYDTQGEELSRESAEFAKTFVIRSIDGRWLIDVVREGDNS